MRGKEDVAVSNISDVHNRWVAKKLSMAAGGSLPTHGFRGISADFFELGAMPTLKHARETARI
jgi:hypothetical protein